MLGLWSRRWWDRNELVFWETMAWDGRARTWIGQGFSPNSLEIPDTTENYQVIQ